ncbi:MBL fold metallo-hydrolase [Gammaproteobacteria bacterium]|nr:MBL fold metallo-hydrolase [Gammaproteobacteria bacterium]
MIKKVGLRWLLLSALLMLGCVSAPVYDGADEPNFDGSHFVNQTPMELGLSDLLRFGWQSLTQSTRWPDWVDVDQQSVPQERVRQGISVTYINHSTTLIQVDGLNILTDPIFSARASPVSFAGPKRIHLPGVFLEDLPEIDVILISHNHYDHLDEASLLSLSERQTEPPMILAGLGNARLFEQLGFSKFQDMQWNDRVQLGELSIVFTEARHRSGRGLTDQMKTLWGSFVIQGPSGNVYFAGDTGYDSHFKDAQSQYGGFELAILPIGAYEPRWFMRSVHLNPADAVRAHQDLQAAESLGIHFGTFQLTLEGINEPVLELQNVLEKEQVDPNHFWTLSPGETRRIK